MSVITSTTAVTPDGLRRFFAACGHQPVEIDFDPLEVVSFLEQHPPLRSSNGE
jgi:hypothetical protein